MSDHRETLFPVAEWQWFGNAGHFICGHRCRFHLCTLVGPWLVSTVGQMPDLNAPESHEYEEIGAGRTFETMVFRAGKPCDAEGCGCGLPALDPPSELESDAYNDAGSATRGHYAMCEKWSKIDPADTERVDTAWQDDDE